MDAPLSDVVKCTTDKAWPGAVVDDGDHVVGIISWVDVLKNAGANVR